jgi:LemA protein
LRILLRLYQGVILKEGEKMQSLIWWLVGGVFLIIIFIMSYNSLIYRKNQVENVQGAVDAYLKERFDLIPNLVAVVKRYEKYERGTLKKITSIRSRALSAKDFDEKVVLYNELEPVFREMIAIIERYPDLKASINFLQLQHTLTYLENNIAAARRAYNQAVVDYNNAVEMFPTNILAFILGFKRKHVFEIPEEERKNISVKELFEK